MRFPRTFAVACLIFIGGCNSDVPQQEPDLLVSVVSFSRQQAPKPLNYPGEIVPRYQSQLAFQVAGRLARRTVDVGTRVASNDLIATLDSRDYQLSSANIDGLKQAARADHQRAGRDLQRAQKLHADGFIGDSQLDLAINAEAASSARLAALVAQHGGSLNRLGYTELTAPERGVITQLHAEVGDVLAPGQPVATLAWLKEWEFAAAIPESRIATLELNQQISVLLWTLHDQPLIGSVREIAPVPDPASRSYTIKVAMEALPPEVKLGMTGSILFFPSDSGQPFGTLPTTALLEIDQQPAVWVIDPDSHVASSQPVTLGPPIGDQMTVISGLREGDLVVVAGANKILPGARVRLLD